MKAILDGRISRAALAAVLFMAGGASCSLGQQTAIAYQPVVVVPQVRCCGVGSSPLLIIEAVRADVANRALD